MASEQEQGPAYESDEFKSMREIAEDERMVRQGWKVSRRGGSLIAVRDGYVRVAAQWIGNDEFVMTWAYDGNELGAPKGDWRAQQYPRDEIVQQWDMTLNAMWR